MMKKIFLELVSEISFCIMQHMLRIKMVNLRYSGIWQSGNLATVSGTRCLFGELPDCLKKYNNLRFLRWLLCIMVIWNPTILPAEPILKENCVDALNYFQEDIKAASDLAYEVGVKQVVVNLGISYADLLSWMYEYENQLIKQKQQHLLSKTYKDGASEFAIDQKSINKAAKQLGISYQSLYNWVRERYGSVKNLLKNGLLVNDHNTSSSKYTEDFKAEAVQLAREKAIHKAAKELDIPYPTLSKWYRDIHGYDQRRSRYTEKFKAKAVQLAHRMGSINKAASKLDVSYWTLVTWYRKTYGRSHEYSGYTEEFRIKAIQLARQKGNEEIARQLNISNELLKEWNPEDNEKSKSEKEFKAKAVQLAHQMGSVKKAAEKLDISYWKLNRWYRKVYRHQKNSKSTQESQMRAVQ